MRLGLDFVMLALLLRQVLATIRHSREIIITDAVGAQKQKKIILNISICLSLVLLLKAQME